jgi:hypothetical protein
MQTAADTMARHVKTSDGWLWRLSVMASSRVGAHLMELSVHLPKLPRMSSSILIQSIIAVSHN